MSSVLRVPAAACARAHGARSFHPLVRSAQGEKRKRSEDEVRAEREAKEAAKKAEEKAKKAEVRAATRCAAR